MNPKTYFSDVFSRNSVNAPSWCYSTKTKLFDESATGSTKDLNRDCYEFKWWCIGEQLENERNLWTNVRKLDNNPIHIETCFDVLMRNSVANDAAAKRKQDKTE